VYRDLGKKKKEKECNTAMPDHPAPHDQIRSITADSSPDEDGQLTQSAVEPALVQKSISKLAAP
jgi:hypothetical protein